MSDDMRDGYDAHVERTIAALRATRSESAADLLVLMHARLHGFERETRELIGLYEQAHRVAAEYARVCRRLGIVREDGSPGDVDAVLARIEALQQRAARVHELEVERKRLAKALRKQKQIADDALSDGGRYLVVSKETP